MAAAALPLLVLLVHRPVSLQGHERQPAATTLLGMMHAGTLVPSAQVEPVTLHGWVVRATHDASARLGPLLGDVGLEVPSLL